MAGQSATAGTPFASRLVATVKDAGGNPVSGVTVTFTPPASGASGAFTGGNTAVTTAAGWRRQTCSRQMPPVAVITSPPRCPEYPHRPSFSLTNTSGTPGSITVTSGSGQSAAINTAFASRLVATVRDAGGNPVADVTVTFTAPGPAPAGRSPAARTQQ